MTYKSIFGSTLCALLLATAVSTNVSAQKKWHPITRAGVGISSSLSPIVSVGLGLGTKKHYQKNTFSLYGDASMFMGERPFYRNVKQISTSSGSTCNLGWSVVPVAQYGLSVSYGNTSLGGGVMFVGKSSDRSTESYTIPNLGSLNGDYITAFVSPFVKAGVNIFGLFSKKGDSLHDVFSKKGGYLHDVFSKMDGSLHLEVEVSYIPKTKNLPEVLNTLDRKIIPFSIGIVYQSWSDNFHR